MTSSRKPRLPRRRPSPSDATADVVEETGTDGANDAVVSPQPDASDEPAEPVDAAAARWRNLLSDLAGGSALGDVDSLGDAAVDLSAAHPGGIAQLFAGRPTLLSNLAREGSALTSARRRARIVVARTDELAQRYGFAPTYVAIGVAHWTPSGDDSPEGERPRPAPIRAPVLLRPVTITTHPADADVELSLEPAVEVNPVLVRALRAHGVTLDVAELIDATQAAHGFTPAPALEIVERLAGDIPGFDVEPRIVLGAFVHPGQALAEDLDVDRLRQHEVVAALAGSEPARRDLRHPLPERRLADQDPETEPGVGDLDAGQHHVLAAVATGMHLLVDAPPGVDVPGTVAALAAQAASEGKRVLYVPGTKRAGESLQSSMRTLGLDGLVLDLGSDVHWRERAAQRLIDGLDARDPDIDDDLAATRRDLTDARAVLADYIRALHSPRPPWQASAYHAMQELAELTAARPGPRTQARLEPAALTMSVDERQHAREELARAAALGAFRLRASDTPWYGTVLTGADHAMQTMERVRRLHQVLPTLAEQVEAAAAQTGLDEAQTLRQWSEQLDLLEGIRASLDLFVPAVFERSAADMAAATGSRAWRAQKGITLSWGVRRRLRKQAKDLMRPGVAVGDLHAELLSVQARRELWRRHCAGGGWPRLPEGMTDILATEEEVAAEIAELQDVLSPSLDGVDLRDVPLGDLLTRVRRLGDDDATLRQMPERAGVLGGLARLGLQPLVDDLTARRVPTELVGAEFDLAWWSGLLEELLRTDPALADLDATSLDVAAERLRELDEAQTQSLHAPLLARVAGHIREAIAADKPKAQEFYLAVRRGATDLRDLQRRFGRVAWASRPVWIVPPMLVPQVLEQDRRIDLVVLDAVQHLPVEQAIPAISRARQVVVIGDTRRGGTGLVAAAASVLPSLALPGDRLDLDAEIAAFLAGHGYDDVIRPVPAPPRPPGITLDVVDGTGMPGLGSEAVESVQAEVDRVVDLVIEHALTRSESSLAVIALNARHADRIRDAVMSTAAGASVAAFFDPAVAEPFTVVDIESVAGLRRDAIVLTVGYGKTPHGRVLYRFGAVSGDNGAELLVDALDACRHRLTVVSCLEPDDLDPDRLRSAGAVALRDLLRFARDGVASSTAPSDGAEDGVVTDRLVQDLAARVERLGLTVVPRFGPPGGVRIPLAVGHPALPGELLLAILTDDPDYVAEPSLRRRDRHWVQRLENRGWSVRTAFSTAVFMDPQGEADKIRARVEEIVADRTGSVPVTEPLPVPEVVDDLEDEPSRDGDSDDDPGADDRDDPGDADPRGRGDDEPDDGDEDGDGAGGAPAEAEPDTADAEPTAERSGADESRGSDTTGRPGRDENESTLFDVAPAREPEQVSRRARRDMLRERVARHRADVLFDDGEMVPG